MVRSPALRHLVKWARWQASGGGGCLCAATEAQTANSSVSRWWPHRGRDELSENNVQRDVPACESVCVLTPTWLGDVMKALLCLTSLTQQGARVRRRPTAHGFHWNDTTHEVNYWSQQQILYLFFFVFFQFSLFLMMSVDGNRDIKIGLWEATLCFELFLKSCRSVSWLAQRFSGSD